MTSKWKKIVLVIAMLLLLATMLTACQLNHSLDELLDKYDAVAKITYHANGGYINDNDKLTDAPVYYKEGSPALNIGFAKNQRGSLSVKRAGYNLGGWYYAALDGNGNLQYELNEETGEDELVLAVAFDFENYRASEGDEIDLYAAWKTDQKLEYLLASDSSIDKIVVGGVTKQAGSKLKTEKFINKLIEIPSKDPLDGKEADKEYVFVGYYYDDECTSPVQWPIRQTDEDENIQIYAKYLAPEWTVVESPADLLKMFGANAISDGKFYIKNDIDASEIWIKEDNETKRLTEIQLLPNATFSGEIRGNGYIISNLSVKTKATARNQTGALFGAIQSGARIHDITLENITVTFESLNNDRFKAYFFASEISDEADISGVVIDGGVMTVNLGIGSRWTNEQDPIFGGEHGGISIVTAPTADKK